MATTRASLIRSPGYITVGTSTTPSTTTNLLQFQSDIKADFVQETEDNKIATQGKIDKFRRDRMVKITGEPKVYSPSQSTLMAFLFPQMNAVPVIGASLCGSSDTPILVSAINGDYLAVYNACVPKRPSLQLHIAKPIIGALEIVGLIRNTFDPETAFAFYKKQTAQGYSAPVLLQSGDLLGYQRYYGNWAAGNTATSNTNWTNFQGQDGIMIDFEEDWQPDKIQGMTVDYKLGDGGQRARARFIPVGPTQSDIELCMQFQGSAGAKQGAPLSGNTAMGNVIFTGQFGATITILNAVMESEGEVFGGVPLRNGEIGLVGTYNMTATPTTGGITLT